ncbi:MAG: chorismate transformation enzyme, FkbO/Hyg5 family [Panacagrimonas sp.]
MSSAKTVAVRLDLDADSAIEPLARFVFGIDTTVPLRALTIADGEEHWIGRAEGCTAERDGIRYAEDGTWLMGTLRVDGAASEDIEVAAFEAYRRLGAFNQGSAYPHLLRVWNYFDRLNQGEGDAERYRRFCVGRHRAIAEPGFESRLPAATVIGSQTPGLVLSFLAGRAPGVQVENPRQTSAFRYPRDYGPTSPSFSRATRVGPHLLVSGTAAVVGHQTRHPDDAAAQFGEIIENLRALLDNAREAADAASAWQAQAIRIYLRRPADLDTLRTRIQAAFPPPTPINILEGDISRSDLALEIEGVWTLVRLDPSHGIRR